MFVLLEQKIGYKLNMNRQFTNISWWWRFSSSKKVRSTLYDVCDEMK